MVIEYADLECPYCAKAHLILKELPVTRVFRHFPVVSKHPRARVLAAAAEAAGASGPVLGDARLAARGPGPSRRPAPVGARRDAWVSTLTASRRDRRSADVAERVERDFNSGISAGVATTPTQFLNGKAHPGSAGRKFPRSLR